MKKKITIFILSILILIFIISIIVSLDRFGVWNPISTLCGILKINLTDNEYTIVQNKPNTVIFIKPDYETNDPREVLNKYMNENGYEEIKEDEMAGNKIYTNRKSNILVEVSTNRYVYCCIIKE